MRRAVLLVGLIIPFLSQDVLAQAGAAFSRQLGSVTPVPNGTVDTGSVSVDFRGLLVPEMMPQTIFFSQIGQTQPVLVQALLTDQSSFTVNPSVYPITYGVMDPSIASISSNGIVTAISGGITFVTANLLGRTVQSIVIVDNTASSANIQIVPTTLQLSEVGAQQQLQVLATLSNGLSVDVTSQSSTTFVSQNPSVASVDSSGLVTALSQGSAVVAVTYGVISSTIGISVSIAPASVLNAIILRSPLSVIRSTNPVQLSVQGILVNGQQTNLTASLSGTVYQISASTVAAVSNNGAVTAVRNGNALITATNSGFSTSSTIRVSFSSTR